jgi:uroporphyrinogen-III decarboxylase
MSKIIKSGTNVLAEEIHQATSKQMATIAQQSSLSDPIFDLGHGSSQFRPPESMAVLVSKVRRCLADFRRGKT